MGRAGDLHHAPYQSGIRYREELALPVFLFTDGNHLNMYKDFVSIRSFDKLEFE